jgi:hypothetical protein
MENLYSFTWNSEYVISLAAAFLPFALVLPKRKYGILMMIAGFIAIYGLWFTRTIPGYSFGFDVLYYIAIYIGLVFLIRYSCELDFIASLFVVTNILCLQHITYKVNLSIVSLIDVHLRDTWWYFIYDVSSMAVCSVAAYLLLAKKMKDVEITINSAIQVVITIAAIVVTIFLSEYTQPVLIARVGDDYGYIIALVSLYAIIICVTSMAFLYQSVIAAHLKEENRVMGLLIEKDKQRYETAKLTAEKIRIKYHDLKHEMSQRQLDEEEMKEFKETETNYQSLMYSGSKALDLLLMEKVSLAEKRGCHIKSVVDGSLLSFMPSYQIYSLFGNILDNAINAASEMKEEEEKIISLSISLLRSNIVITCSNYTKEAPIIVGGLPKTRHKDKENHGYGMKSIRNTVLAHKGVFKITYEDRQFKLKIAFPHKEEVKA